MGTFNDPCINSFKPQFLDPNEGMAAMSSKVQVGCLPRKLVDFTNKDWFISKKDWN